MDRPRVDERELWAWDEAHAPRGPVEEGWFARGWRLGGESWRMLRRDPGLLFLPIVSTTTTLLAGLLLLGPVVWWARDHGGRWPYGVAIAVGTFILNFTSTFFGVAFVSAAGRSFRGEPADVRAALAHAVRRLGPIVAWTLVSTAVGMLIRALERVHAGVLVNVVLRWILGVIWGLATIFMVPVIASEGVGPIRAMRRSIGAVRKGWGEAVVGSAYVGGLVLVVVLPALVCAGLGYLAYGGAPALGVALIAIAALAIVGAMTVEWAMTSLFRLALYRYATEGAVVGPFAEADLRASFRSKN
jgi:hypothetical protein